MSYVLICVPQDIIYIKPDVTVKKIDGEFVLEGNNTNDINIHINSFYKEILNDESSDIVAKEFIKDRLDSALNLIKSIEHRKSTTIMIANSILNKQKDFFEKGIHPLFLEFLNLLKRNI